MATLKAREGTNLTANRGSAPPPPPPPQRTNSFNGRQLSAPPPQRTSSYNGRRSSAPSSPRRSISSFHGRQLSAPSSPVRTSSFNARRSSAPPSPQRRTSSSSARRSSAPPSPTSSFNARRSPRPSTPENPLPPVGAIRPTHNHLKTRPATPVNAPKSSKSLQPTSTASTKRLPIAKPATEKPPSPSPGPSRASSSPNLLKEGSIRLPHAALRRFTSLKSSLEKVPKIPSGAKTGQLARTRSLGAAREASATAAAVAATSVPRTIGSSIPVRKFAGGKRTGQLSRTMSLGINEEFVTGMETEQEQNEDVEQLSHIAAPKLDEEQDAVDSTLILDRRHAEPLEPNSDAEEAIDGSMQLQEEEEQAKEEDSKIDEGEDMLESKPTDGAQGKEAKPAKFVRSRSAVATKKETTLSHNDVIEEAKSKLLEKRKNRVLALVGAFETVMALQEPDGQAGRG